VSTVHAQENTSVNAVTYPGLESKMCFVTDENMMFKVSLESKYSGSEVYVIIKSKTTQLRYFDMFIGENGNYYTIPLNIQDATSRKVGNFSADVYIRDGATGIEDDKKMGTVFFYHARDSCLSFQEYGFDEEQKVEQTTDHVIETNPNTNIPESSQPEQDKINIRVEFEPLTIMLIIIPVIVIVIIVVIVKTKKKSVSHNTRHRQEYHYSNSHSEYSKEYKCHFCKNKFPRIHLTKITKEFSTELPEGKYVCRECLRKRREYQERIRFENRKKSYLRDFRTRADYAPLETEHHLREKVTTDEEFDAFIIDLETKTNDDFEFRFIEKLIDESMRFEFFQRRKASAGTQDETPTKETVDSELEYSYKILDLSVGTEWNKVKERYRELVREYHPDRNPNDHKQWCDEMMKQINKAYETIEKSFEK
tara:strand:- start:489 stop:1754 length:1266 start_codon:yes stop_codon:yes gene_type:complete